MREEGKERRGGEERERRVSDKELKKDRIRIMARN